MEDISPGLLNRIREDFTRRIENSPTIRALHDAIQSGNATYIHAEDYAYEVGSALAEAFGANLSSSVLPDGRMYYNIAQSVVRPMLEEDHAILSDAAAQVQNSLNEKAGIHIKAQTVPVNDDRINGIIDKVSDADVFDDVAWVLQEPVKNFSMNVVDETLRANVEFQGKAGLQPRIIRRTRGKCCKWCSDLAGVYDYFELYDRDDPREVFRRHERCRCTVDYDPGSGKVQNVHTKQWKNAHERGIINLRKNIDPRAARQSASRLFRTQGDPMVEVTGPAEKSHPDKISAFRKELSESGVEIVQRQRESLGYAPGFLPGSPGTIYVSEGASYSAWCHEMQHMRDDRDAGWSGMRILSDLDERYAREERAYAVEIALAMEEGREDIAERLRANLAVERRIIYGD